MKSRIPFRVPAANKDTTFRNTMASQLHVVEDFHRVFYDSKNWALTRWMGHRVLKNPADLWLYQEIIHDHRPDFIVETGTAYGGSAFYMASLLDLVGHGEVISIDICAARQPEHPRVTYLTGSSVDPGLVADVTARVGDARSVLVVLDSCHATEHVRQELEAYSPLVRPGGYLIVEDSNVDGNPVEPDYVEAGLPGGPMAAIESFLETHDEFEIDTQMHRYFVTHNPNGYLRRKG